MAIWGVISAGLLGLAGYFVHTNGKGYWKEWLLSLCVSYGAGWLFSLALTVTMFTLMFNCCKKNDHKFKFVVTYQDYVNWESGCIQMTPREKNNAYSQVSQDEIDVVQPVDL